MQAVAAQRRGRDGAEALLTALGALHVHGVGVDWQRVVGAGGRRGLARYRPMRSSGSATGLRLRRRAVTFDDGAVGADHPLLGAATALAESDGFLLTGRLSLAEAGWLRDHAVFGTVLLPGTGLLELGFAAARAVGLSVVSQLTLLAPLVLPAEGAVRVQVQLEGPEAARMAAGA